MWERNLVRALVLAGIIAVMLVGGRALSSAKHMADEIRDSREFIE